MSRRRRRELRWHTAACLALAAANLLATFLPPVGYAWPVSAGCAGLALAAGVWSWRAAR